MMEINDELRQLLRHIDEQIEDRGDNVDACVDKIKAELVAGNFVEVVKTAVASAEESGYLTALEMCAHRLRKLVDANR